MRRALACRSFQFCASTTRIWGLKSKAGARQLLSSAVFLCACMGSSPPCFFALLCGLTSMDSAVREEGEMKPSHAPTADSRYGPDLNTCPYRAQVGLRFGVSVSFAPFTHRLVRKEKRKKEADTSALSIHVRDRRGRCASRRRCCRGGDRCHGRARGRPPPGPAWSSSPSG